MMVLSERNQYSVTISIFNLSMILFLFYLVSNSCDIYADRLDATFRIKLLKNVIHVCTGFEIIYFFPAVTQVPVLILSLLVDKCV